MKAKYLTRFKEKRTSGKRKSGHHSWRTALVLISAYQLISFSAFSQNVFVTNSPTKPANVILRDTTGAYVAAGGGGGAGGDASAANQTAVQANAGSDATKATAVQGITGGKALPVTGTFWQATQPVSGTFWQATQPVSIASVPSHAVTNAGTFATQSVATQKQLTGVPSTFTIATADATVFTLAAGEIGFIQNLDDAALAVKKGAAASTTSLSFILAAGTAADDGKGGAIRIDDWVGAVSVAAMAGSPRFIAWKVAP